MGLFSKKPGGTFFGNLLRGAASKATGGLIGTGANRIELGQTQTNAQLAAQQQSQQDIFNQNLAVSNAGVGLMGGFQDAIASQNTPNYTNTLPIVGQFGNTGTMNLLFIVALGLGAYKLFFAKKR